MLCKLLFFSLPFILLLIFQQLHTVPSYFFSVIYLLINFIYCFIDERKINNKILKDNRKYFINGVVVTFSITLIITAFPIGGYMTVPLIMEHSQEKADAVLVLASGATLAGDPCLACYQRVLHGANLVKNGQAKHLYISTGYSTVNGFQEYYTVASLTQILNIPKDKITIFKSKEIITTATEAAYAKQYLNSIGINKILLTTSNAHIYRSCLVFKKIGFEVLPAPSHTKESTVYADDNLSMFRAALHEWIGLVWYWLRNRI